VFITSRASTWIAAQLLLQWCNLQLLMAIVNHQRPQTSAVYAGRSERSIRSPVVYCTHTWNTFPLRICSLSWSLAWSTCKCVKGKPFSGPEAMKDTTGREGHGIAMCLQFWPLMRALSPLSPSVAVTLAGRHTGTSGAEGVNPFCHARTLLSG
jgi:hypothetical protein